MKKLVCFCSLFIAAQFANATGKDKEVRKDIQRGICTGLTTSGKTVEMTFCAPEGKGSKLVSCTGKKGSRPEVEVTRTLPDQSEETRVLEVKYSKIEANKEDAFEAKAYSVTNKDLKAGLDHEWVSVNAVAEGPSAFIVDMGTGWRFSFANAQCHFENLEQEQQQQKQEEQSKNINSLINPAGFETDRIACTPTGGACYAENSETCCSGICEFQLCK